MLVFQPQENALFALAGLPLGRIVDDQDNTYPIMHEDEAEAALVALSKAGYSEDAIETMRGILIGLNFAADLGTLIAAMTQVNLGDDYDPGEVEFRVCGKENCIPFPHGNIMDGGSAVDFMSTASMEQGLKLIMGGLKGGHITAEQGIFLLQQMTKADLIVEEATMEQRFRDMPDENKKLPGGIQVSRAIAIIPGLGARSGTLIGIDLERLFGLDEDDEDTPPEGDND
jgi:hypothetical protein